MSTSFAKASDGNRLKATFLKRRSLISLASACAALLSTIAIWSALAGDHDADIADVAESVSYGTRSELVRRLEIQFSALRRVALYWAAYGDGTPSSVPRLASDAKIELDHFEGVEFIAWRYPNRELRFFTETKSLDLTREPTSEEWVRVEDALRRITAEDQEALVGPEIDDEGQARYVLYVPVSLGDARGDLISSINVTANLDALLLDEAPGYSIRVSCCEGEELYRRGEPAEALDEAWIRDGWIELSPGATWNVAHAPTQELVDDLNPWALDATLILGLVMSLLLGAFVHETIRARSRARVATAAKAEVAAANAALEVQVEARTKSLSEALSDINTINLSVTHDLRSPLQTIALTARALEARHGERLGEWGIDRLRTIRSNASYMGAFLDRLLSFSRASSFEYERTTVDMRAMAQRVATGLLRNQPHRAEVVVGELPPCEADATMVHILLTNLIDNALKHASGRHEEARIDVGYVERDGETIYFVEDNGPGFAPADAERLFEPLERLERNGEVKGLGLGLAIVKRIVERHGGRVWAESTEGVGATFFFTLSAAER